MSQRLPRAHYTAYIGNVTLQNFRTPGDGKVVWLKGQKDTEAQIADILNDAYKLGRKHALEDVENSIKEAKR